MKRRALRKSEIKRELLKDPEAVIWDDGSTSFGDGYVTSNMLWRLQVEGVIGCISEDTRYITGYGYVTESEYGATDAFRRASL